MSCASGLAGEVHLWVVRLDQPIPDVSSMEEVLSGEERLEARRYRNHRESMRFVIRRAARRITLAKYVGCPPARLEFSASALGKPSLAHSSGIVFNCTASNDLAIIAAAEPCRIGVDLEHIRPMPDALDTARDFLSDAENAALRAAPPDKRGALFLLYWTRKEALAKALGIGLREPFLEFTVEPGLGGSMVFRRSQSGATERWNLISLEPAPEYVATLACDANADDLKVTLKYLDEHWYKELH